MDTHPDPSSQPPPPSENSATPAPGSSDSGAGEPPPADPASSLSANRALMVAWIVWVVMLVVPFVLTLVTLVAVWWRDNPHATLATVGAVVAGLWIMIAVPLAFLARDHVFKSYWQGRVVDPDTYLRGMITIWATMEIGGIIALVGCLISGALMPGLLLAAVAFMLFFPFWPNGSAMTDTVGNVDDDEVFHHPR